MYVRTCVVYRFRFRLGQPIFVLWVLWVLWVPCVLSVPWVLWVPWVQKVPKGRSDEWERNSVVVYSLIQKTNRDNLSTKIHHLNLPRPRAGAVAEKQLMARCSRLFTSATHVHMHTCVCVHACTHIQMQEQESSPLTNGCCGRSAIPKDRLV